jgi:hypothetical protein
VFSFRPVRIAAFAGRAFLVEVYGKAGHVTVTAVTRA